MCCAGAMAATPKGRAAPMEKLPADAMAASSGRALVPGVRPSSSRACEPKASCAMSWSATLRGEAGIQSAPYVNLGQFVLLAGEIIFQFGAFLRKRCSFEVGLRVHRDVFSGRHGHARRQPAPRCRSAADSHARRALPRGRAAGWSRKLSRHSHPEPRRAANRCCPAYGCLCGERALFSCMHKQVFWPRGGHLF